MVWMSVSVEMRHHLFATDIHIQKCEAEFTGWAVPIICTWGTASRIRISPITAAAGGSAIVPGVHCLIVSGKSAAHLNWSFLILWRPCCAAGGQGYIRIICHARGTCPTNAGITRHPVFGQGRQGCRAGLPSEELFELGVYTGWEGVEVAGEIILKQTYGASSVSIAEHIPTFRSRGKAALMRHDRGHHRTRTPFFLIPGVSHEGASKLQRSG